MDSRLVIYYQYRQKAVDTWNAAERNYKKAVSDANNNSALSSDAVRKNEYLAFLKRMRDSQRETALTYLGVAAHALQEH